MCQTRHMIVVLVAASIYAANVRAEVPDVTARWSSGSCTETYYDWHRQGTNISFTDQRGRVSRERITSTATDGFITTTLAPGRPETWTYRFQDPDTVEITNVTTGQRFVQRRCAGSGALKTLANTAETKSAAASPSSSLEIQPDPQALRSPRPTSTDAASSIEATTPPSAPLASPPPARPPMPPADVPAPDMSAAKELVALGIPYTQENFEKAVDDGDINALTLFLKAGHSANEIAARGGDPVAGLAVAHNKRNLAQELNLFVKYGLDFKLTGHFNNFGHLLSELLHRPVTQEEILLYQAEDADTAKIIIAAGADPTTLLNGLRKLKQAHTLPNWAQSRLAALEAAAPNVSFDPPSASTVDASKFDVRGIKLGMTAGQVLDAAKASSMTAQQFTITNNKAETGVVLRDITAAHIEGTPSQQVKAAVTGGSSVPLRSGLKLVAWISAKDHTVMEIEARNAGVDPSENDAGGQLYSVGVQKWGEPTVHGSAIAPSTAISRPAAAYWGNPEGVHVSWKRTNFGDNEMLDDLGDERTHRYEFDIIDPQARKASLDASHPSVAAPKL